jgi:hypothetical protein
MPDPLSPAERGPSHHEPSRHEPSRHEPSHHGLSDHDPATDERTVRGVFDEFEVRAGTAVPLPDLPSVRTRARRRQRSWAIAGVAAAALVVPVAVYAVAGRAAVTGDGSPLAEAPGASTSTSARVFAPLPGAPSAIGSAGSPPGPAVVVGASGAPAATVTHPPPDDPTPGSIRDTDWPNVTLDIPANQTGCAAGTAHFQHAIADVGATRYFLGGGENHTFEIAYGDVDADGQAEALLVVSCLTPTGRTNPPSIVLLIGANPVHTMALAFTSSPRIGDGEARSYVSATVIQSDGAISYLIRTFEGNGQCEYHQRWTGTGLRGECDP